MDFGVVKITALLTIMFLMLTAILTTFLPSANVAEENDPDRDYFITMTNITLNHGEITDKIFTQMHTATRTTTELEWRYDYGFNVVSGQFEFYYGFHPTTVTHSEVIPNKWVLKIMQTDEERLIFYVNEIEVSECVFEKYSVGEIYKEGE